ncbi:aminoglycoside phosphotransferase family protein [Fimbriimonas ginsengisoli]|uniref:Putative aminoglycoside/hydroxyurea antibiotic resistance kinase n=1 Tax=Fimbriimonas ginsengisoli Gsoil 348 TaxID=661478 RepID=A0A068NLK5_FIMGI|nr:aminoglycoside phosphotransferase family protein [Fimbriimonas ginsengisoli]AIE84361.1 putative aminoglycoside/hydroxyurea antibiotic resistance kinase [Fimbriimonas ginsengisoli Gsoil 348]
MTPVAPENLESIAQRWHLSLGEPFGNLSYNYVLRAIRSDGTSVVLKLGKPGPEFRSEACALEHFAGRGAVRLIEADIEAGAMLLEHLTPGDMLTSRSEEESIAIAADVMRNLWRAAPDSDAFPDLRRWTAGLGRLRETFDGGCGPFPAHAVDRAERLREELLASEGEQVLLHGDLHHANILSSTREAWLAIDPKGVVGEREFELPSFLVNPRQETREVLDHRVRAFCEILSLDLERAISWSIVFGVLSSWWGYEDGGEVWEGPLEFSEQMARLA